jgi:hypothetical protein
MDRMENDLVNVQNVEKFNYIQFYLLAALEQNGKQT